MHKSIVPESDAIEFAEDEVVQEIGAEPFGDDGISYPVTDVLVDAEVEVGEQGGLAEEDEVVVFAEVFEEELQLAEVDRILSVINNLQFDDNSANLNPKCDQSAVRDNFLCQEERRSPPRSPLPK